MSDERGLNFEEDLTIGPTPYSWRTEGEGERPAGGPTPEPPESDRASLPG